MDDKHILQYMQRMNSVDRSRRNEHYGHRQYNGNDETLRHSIGKSMGLGVNNINKMPMDGDISYPLFTGETKFINTTRRRYPTQNSIQTKKKLSFISKDDEF